MPIHEVPGAFGATRLRSGCQGGSVLALRAFSRGPHGSSDPSSVSFQGGRSASGRLDRCPGAGIHGLAEAPGHRPGTRDRPPRFPKGGGRGGRRFQAAAVRGRVFPERPRAEAARTAWQDEEAGVVAHEVQAVEPHAAVPPDPAVARAALRCRSREDRQRQPAIVTVDDAADGLAHRRQRAEAAVFLQQAPEAGLFACRNRADGRLRKNRIAAPFADSPRIWRDRERAEGPETGSVNCQDATDPAGTDPPWSGCR